MFQRMGVRGRLLLAFMGISAFALIAAAAAMYAFSEVGGALDRITNERLPAALDAVALSRQAERIVAAAPKLLAVTDAETQTAVSSDISGEVSRLDELHARLREEIKPARWQALGDHIAQIGANLGELDVVIGERLALAAEHGAIMRQLLNAARVARRLSEPGKALIESRLAEWQSSGSDQTDEPIQIDPAELTGTFGAILPQQRAELVVGTIAEGAFRIAAADDQAKLAVLAKHAERALKQLEEHIAEFPPKLRERAHQQWAIFNEALLGERGLIEIRGAELAALDRANDVLDANADISDNLTAAVEDLVIEARGDIDRSTSDAAAAQKFSANVLIAVVLLSLLCSGLIVWLYVHRDLLKRLGALSSSMLAVAGGNLRVALPSPTGQDEITDMTKALTVFRDTAVEVEEKGLREIDRARQQLVDAIESISEGFALYDDADQIVLYNTRYKELLNAGDDIALGTPFEAIIWRSAELGLVDHGHDDVEGYVQERLALHRNPGQPILQHRTSGHWILIGERRVAQGGTVAVFSDITELKQREVELEEANQRTQEAADEINRRNRELEVLSGKLAKYLSPQVYASIFAGKQEVKLASERKKLTVFFSDIAGFTATTDRLESEELTQLLNQYLTEMSEVALAHGATIDKYVGDAIMIFFGDPESKGVKEDAQSCVKMAIAMQKRMRDLAKSWRDAGMEQPLLCRIGINTGFCTVGNFGSEDRMDYTIIGGAVNLASRLENEAEPGGILLSYETYAHVKDEIHCEEVGRIQVRGISHPVTTYRAIDLYANLADGNGLILEETSHLKIEANPGDMTTEDRARAIATLEAVTKRLSDTGN